MAVYLILLVHQIISSLTHIIAKDLTHTYDPTALLLFRAMISVVFYALWFTIDRKLIKRIEKKDIITFIILGVLNIPINQMLFMHSIHLTTAPNVALAYALSPAFVLIITLIFTKTKVGILERIGIPVAVAGAGVIIFERGLNISSDSFLGDMLVLLASLSWALYTIIGRRINLKYGAIYSTGMAMGIGFGFYLPIYFFINPPNIASSFGSLEWLKVLYLGSVTSGVAYALWNYSLKKMDSSRVSVFNNLQPVLTTIMAVIIFNHQITLSFIFGGLLIIGGVILTQIKTAKPL